MANNIVRVQAEGVAMAVDMPEVPLKIAVSASSSRTAPQIIRLDEPDATSPARSLWARLTDRPQAKRRVTDH